MKNHKCKTETTEGNWPDNCKIENCKCGAYKLTWPSGKISDWHKCKLCRPNSM